MNRQWLEEMAAREDGCCVSVGGMAADFGLLEEQTMLRCKFKVDSVQENDAGDSRLLTLSACVDETGDNENWSKWTPAGQFSIHVSNPEAFAQIDAMQPGDVHYIDVSDKL